MGFYPDSFLEQIKNKTDIVDLISNYTNVSRKGRDYWACCPFHNEKTPSFQIRNDHQYYRCYGCGKHGNVFTFLMEYDKSTFSEAVENLAKRAGLEIPEQNADPEYKARKEQQEKTYTINRETARFYYKNLFLPEGTPALEYFAQRGLDNKIINKFGMGFSIDFTSLPKYLQKIGYDEQTLLTAGVVSEGKNGELFDFFGGRIIIPIIAGNGKIVGFTGRVLVSKPEFAKYKNTPGTPVFNKRKNLFGINLYKQYKQSDVRAMVLVEGHMDVVSLYQAGIFNSVASMGTSLTIEQCREIKRYADVVYVSFDGDSAGQIATLRGLDLLKEQGLEVRVVSLTNGLDPDDYVRKFGKDGYSKLLDEAMPLIDYKLQKAEEGFNLKSNDDKIKYAKNAIAVLNGLDNVEREVYAESVSKKSGLTREVILQRSKEIEPELPVRTQEVDKQADNALAVAERFVVSSFIYGKNYIDFDTLTEIRKIMQEPKHVQVFDRFVKDLTNGKKPKASDVFDILENDPLASDLVDAIDTIPSSSQESYYNECIKILHKSYKNKEMNRLVSELNNETDESVRENLKSQIKDLTKSQPK